MKNRIMTLIFIIIFVLIDQVSKYFFYDSNLGNKLGIINPAFNTGISRSLPINMILIIVLSLGIMTIIFRAYHKKYIGKRALIFLISGTIGNLLDRIFLGGVRDFVHIVKWFPIFNLADVFICSGAAIILIKEFFLLKK